LADRVTSMKQQLIQFASTDPLTGLLNRRAFFDHAAEMCLAAQNGKSLSAIMFDIDYFKGINDTHGHEIGDKVLVAVGSEAKVINGAAGRLGGEEFCVLAFGEVEDALECAGELQRSVRALRFEHERQEFSITCSFGVAEWEEHDTVDAMLRRADVAMYEAKKSGRDRIVLSDTYALASDHDNWRGAARSGRRPLVKRGA
jgi:two-component system, cell cycle response regulator